LKDIAKTQRKTLSDLVGSIDTQREQGNLSSDLRLFVLGHYQGHTGDQKAASLRFLSHAHEPPSQLIE
jgi:predicted DNA-binding ribbon-helix-helix protein